MGRLIIMWQTVGVVVLLVIVAVYLVHHLVRVFRGETPSCGCCAGSCSKPPGEVAGGCPEQSLSDHLGKDGPSSPCN